MRNVYSDTYEVIHMFEGMEKKTVYKSKNPTECFMFAQMYAMQHCDGYFDTVKVVRVDAFTGAREDIG